MSVCQPGSRWNQKWHIQIGKFQKNLIEGLLPRHGETSKSSAGLGLETAEQLGSSLGPSVKVDSCNSSTRKQIVGAPFLLLVLSRCFSQAGSNKKQEGEELVNAAHPLMQSNVSIYSITQVGNLKIVPGFSYLLPLSFYHSQ